MVHIMNFMGILINKGNIVFIFEIQIFNLLVFCSSLLFIQKDSLTVLSDAIHHGANTINVTTKD